MLGAPRCKWKLATISGPKAQHLLRDLTLKLVLSLLEFLLDLNVLFTIHT